MRHFDSEAQLAERAVEWLEAQGFDVYKEVKTALGNRIDIVGKRGNLTYAIETKISAGFGVIEQAETNLLLANWSMVCIPGGMKRSNGHRIFERTLQQNGLGLLVATPGSFIVEIQPKFNRPKLKSLADYLHQDQKQSIAGSNRGGYSTPFSRLRKQIIEVVKANPGITLKEIVSHKGVNCYWSKNSATSTLKAFIGKGLFPGIETRKEGRVLCLYVKEEQVL
jgi:hypothetical protein